MGKLYPPVILYRFTIKLFIGQGVKGEPVFKGFLVVVKYKVDPVVQPRQQNAAPPQHPEAFPPNRVYILHIAVGNWVKDKVKALIRKGQGLCHIRLHRFNFISFPPGHQQFTVNLGTGIVQHRTPGP